MNLKIANKKKFIRSILIILGVIMFISLFISNISFSHGENKYKTIYVSNGDTLWSIAKEEQENNAYYEDKDIREVVSNIKTVNKLNNSDLSTNQKLVIPCI
ncbi:MAG: LysM peptidoglycan-binding domain-containing protein [Clostridia bacterium]|nr:LysM peptidoglycan-binding domain-containing protein [Clostridia bacterium]